MEKQLRCQSFLSTFKNQSWLDIKLLFKFFLNIYLCLFMSSISVSFSLSFSSPCQVDVFCRQQMACILLTDMEPPNAQPPALQNGAPSDPDPTPAPDSKPEEEAICLSVQLYYVGKVGSGTKRSEDVLTFPAGEYVAEDLCIAAAKACGESHDSFSFRFYQILNITNTHFTNK